MGAAAGTVRVLGPIEIELADRVVEVPSASQRRLLAALAVHAPQPVRLDWLCWALGVSSGAVRTTVTRLRRVGGEELIATTATGYRLGAAVDTGLVADELRRAGDDPDAMGRALSRWNGRALEEFRDESWAAGEVARLDEVYATAVEDRADALIRARRLAEAITMLEPHVRTHEYRDRPQGQLIRALAATGRQTEALRRYQDYRHLLAEHVGTEPSEDLRRIEQRIATGWNGIDEDGTARPVPAPPSVPRRSVPTALTVPDDIVGRHSEMAKLEAAAAEVLRGEAAVVLVEGEAGIGKTSLVSAFVRAHVDPARWRISYDRCDDVIGEPLQPAPGLLGRLVAELPDEVLAAHSAMCGGDLLRLVPQLRTRTDVPRPEPVDDQSTARHLLFHAATDMVRRAAELDPLLLVVDDLHWAEPTGLQLLVHLVREVVALPVLVIATLRDTGEADRAEVRAAVADLVRLGAQRIALAGLDAGELDALIRSRVADAAQRELGTVVSQLAADTAGNPLFAQHLLRHWSDTASLAFSAAAVTVDVHGGAPPASIRDLVWRRVAALGPLGTDVLGAAAVLGVEFEEPVVAAMTGAEQADLDECLDRAVAAGLVAAGAGPALPTRFTHAVVARSLEAELGERARSRLHGAAFDALVARASTSANGGSPVRAARLAHHAERAGRIADACHWAARAGTEAMATFAAEEAVGWFRRALGHAVALGRPDAERADLMVRLGEAEYRAGHPSGLDSLHEAASLAERCGADDVLLDAALAIDPGSIIRFGRFAPQQLAIAESAHRRAAQRDLATRARIEALLAQSLVHTDQTERRNAAAVTALELARASGDPGVVARVAPDVLIALWAPGTALQRLAVAAEATAVVETLGDPSLSATVYYAAHTAAVCARDATAARRYHERLRAIAEEIAEPRARWMASITDAFTATMSGRFRDAEAHIATGFEIGTRIGEPETFAIFSGQTFAVGTFEGRHGELFPVVQHVMDTSETVDLTFRIAHAILSVEVGELAAPRALLHEAMARGLSTIRHDMFRSTAVLGYAVLALELDDASAAAALLPEVAPLADEVSFNAVTSQGPIAAYVGKLLTLLGRHEEAERHLLDALATTEAFGWEYHRASTLLALADNRDRAGTYDEQADRWLDDADALCAAHGLAVWARRVRELRERRAG